jgi:hypothetical protein
LASESSFHHQENDEEIPLVPEHQVPLQGVAPEPDILKMPVLT